VSSTSSDHVENTPSTSESEAPGQKGKCKFPCKLCEGDHAIHRCPFLDEAKRVLDDRSVSPLRLPLGYKKLLLTPSLVENLADTPLWSVEASIIEDNHLNPHQMKVKRSRQQLTRSCLQRIHLQMIQSPKRTRMTPSKFFS